MPKYLIERQLPGAGALTPAQLQEISCRSNSALAALGPGIQWVHSYVTPDAIYCVYIAQNEQLIRDHASRGGFPVTRIARIAQSIDPTTAEMAVSDSQVAHEERVTQLFSAASRRSPCASDLFVHRWSSVRLDGARWARERRRGLLP